MSAPPLFPGFPYRVLDHRGRYVSTLVVEDVRPGPVYRVRWLGQRGQVELTRDEVGRLSLEFGRWL